MENFLSPISLFYASSVRQKTLLAFASFSLFNFIYYRNLLSCFITGADTFFQISTSRFDSFSGLIRILTDPQMGHDYSIGGDIAYRPLVNLQFGVEYMLWGVNPLGYHLFDVFTHMAVVILLFVLVRKMFKSYAIALSAGLIFSFHPAVLRSMTGPGGAGDMMVSVLFLLAFISFLYFRDRPRKAMMFVSLSAYILALLTKESAYALWLLFFAWVFIFNEPGSDLRERFVSSVRATWKYPAAAILVLFIRTIVLHGIGGYRLESTGIRGFVAVSVDHARQFFLDLFTENERIFFLGLLIPKTLAVEILVVLLIICAFVLRRRLYHFFFKTEEGKILGFVSLWLILPLMLHLMTRTFNSYNMYFPSIPFCILLAFGLVEGCKKLFRQSRFDNEKSRLMETLAYVFGWAGIALIVLLVASASYNSSRPYDGHIARNLFTKIEDTVLANPQANAFELYNYPEAVSHLSNNHETENKYLKAWLEISVPSRSIDSNIMSFDDARLEPVALSFREWNNENTLALQVITKDMAP